MIMEATFTGFVVRPFENFVCSNIIVDVFIPIDEDTTNRLLKGLRQVAVYLGSLYDFSNILGFIFVCIARWLGKKIRNFWGNPKRLICSEAVGRLILYGKVPGLAFDPETLSPKDLRYWLLSNPNFRRISLNELRQIIKVR